MTHDPPKNQAETTNLSRLKRQKIGEMTQAEMTRPKRPRAETTQGRNDHDTVSRFWILFHMGKKNSHSPLGFTKTITNRFTGSSQRITRDLKQFRIKYKQHFCFAREVISYKICQTSLVYKLSFLFPEDAPHKMWL